MKYKIKFRVYKGKNVFFNLYDILEFFSKSQPPQFRSYDYDNFAMNAFTSNINSRDYFRLFITGPDDKCPFTMYLDTESCCTLSYSLFYSDMPIVENYRSLFRSTAKLFLENEEIDKYDYNSDMFKLEKTYKIKV